MGEENRHNSSRKIKTFKDGVKKIEARLDTLLDSRLDGEISKTEYTFKKEKLLNERQDLHEKMKAFRQEGNNWLEPLRDFILSLKKAKKTALSGDLNEYKIFLKNIGSNFILKGKKFEFYPNLGWRSVAQSASFTLSHGMRESNPRPRFWRPLFYH